MLIYSRDTLQHGVSVPVIPGWGGDINTCVRPGADVTELSRYPPGGGGREEEGKEGREQRAGAACVCSWFVQRLFSLSGTLGNFRMIFKLKSELKCALKQESSLWGTTNQNWQNHMDVSAMGNISVHLSH